MTRKEVQHRYYEKHKEKLKAYAREYMRKYRAEHREELRARERERYQKMKMRRLMELIGEKDNEVAAGRRPSETGASWKDEREKENR